jgi:hypothetical protein
MSAPRQMSFRDDPKLKRGIAKDTGIGLQEEVIAYNRSRSCQAMGRQPRIAIEVRSQILGYPLINRPSEPLHKAFSFVFRS